MPIVKRKNIEPFNIFILRIWKNPAICNKILFYQHTQNTTSMAILWCLWHDYHHSQVHIKTLIHMIKQAKTYEQKYIIPIRKKRTQAIKNSHTYKNLLQEEIKTEMQLCSHMSRTLPHPIPQNHKIPPNINIYFKQLKF